MSHQEGSPGAVSETAPEPEERTTKQNGKKHTREVAVAMATAFLQRLDPAAERFTFQTFDDDKKRQDRKLACIRHGTIEQHFDELAKLQDSGAGVFVTVNRTDLKGRTKDNITHVRALWQEDDGAGKPLPLTPHLVVESSPGKAHRYLLVDGLSNEDFDAVQAVLVADYGSDKDAKDRSRVLRLPGFFHLKDRKRPHLVRLVEVNERPPYARDEIMRAFPCTPGNAPVAKSQPAQPAIERFISLSPEQWRELRSALFSMRSDERELWIAMVHALRELGDQGRGLWLEWSATSDAFDPKDAARVWDSIKAASSSYKAVFTEAQRRGWANPRKGQPIDPLLETGLDGDQPRAKRQFRLIAPGELLAPKPIDWLIKGYIERGVLALLFGDWGTGKSFIAIALALAVARGGEWNGQPVKGSGPVLYLAGEGHQGIGRRYRAQALHLDVDLTGLPFYVTDSAVQFLRPKERGELLQLLDTLDIRPVLIVVDTLHRHFNGGVENDEADMGKFVEACDTLRVATGATVLVVHHVGHNDKGRPRGSSALPADFDVMFGIEFNKTVKAGKLACAKMKDAEEPPSVKFALRSVELGRDEDGDAITSAVPVFGDAATEPVVFEPQELLDLTKGVRAIALVELADLLEHEGLEPTPDAADDGARLVADVDDWRDRVLAGQRTENQKTAQKNWQRARKELAEHGLALSTDDEAFAWITPDGFSRLAEARKCAKLLRSPPRRAIK